MASPLDRPLSTQFFVDGTPLYEPDADGGIQMEWNSIAAEGSGRTQDGVMHIEWVKRRIPKAKFSYKAVTKEQLAYMNNLVQGKTFQFTCPKRMELPKHLRHIAPLQVVLLTAHIFIMACIEILSLTLSARERKIRTTRTVVF